MKPDGFTDGLGQPEKLEALRELKSVA